MSLKMLREDLCRRQTEDLPPDVKQGMARLIELIDTHRPLGPDGKHANRHTPTCGCEDLACAWADYRKDYGVNQRDLQAAHKAFKAGWQAAREGDQSGPIR